MGAAGEEVGVVPGQGWGGMGIWEGRHFGLLPLPRMPGPHPVCFWWGEPRGKVRVLGLDRVGERGFGKVGPGKERCPGLAPEIKGLTAEGAGCVFATGRDCVYVFVGAPGVRA